MYRERERERESGRERERQTDTKIQGGRERERDQGTKGEEFRAIGTSSAVEDATCVASLRTLRYHKP